MEKKKYINPSIDIVVIQDQNIVTEASTGVGGDDDEGGTNT